MAFMCQHKISALRLIPSSNQSQALTMLYSFWLSISLTSSLFRSFAFAAKCYYPDGSPVLENDFQPCVLISGIDSMCCATNRDSLPDTCLANGLCHNPCKNQDDCSNIPGRYWRESCTDPSWNSPFCLRGVCASSNVSLEWKKCSNKWKWASWVTGDWIKSDQCAVVAVRNRRSLVLRRFEFRGVLCYGQSLFPGSERWCIELNFKHLVEVNIVYRESRVKFTAHLQLGPHIDFFLNPNINIDICSLTFPNWKISWPWRWNWNWGPCYWYYRRLVRTTTKTPSITWKSVSAPGGERACHGIWSAKAWVERNTLSAVGKRSNACNAGDRWIEHTRDRWSEHTRDWWIKL